MSWDSIAQLLLANGGTLTNGVLVVILLWFLWYTYRRIVNGDLVPRAVHEDTRKERDVWRETAQTNAQQREQLIASLDVTQTLLRSVHQSLTMPAHQRPATHDDAQGGAHGIR